MLDPVKLGQKRWKGVSAAKKSEHGRMAANARWAKARAQKKNGPNGPK